MSWVKTIRSFGKIKTNTLKKLKPGKKRPDRGASVPKERASMAA